MDAFTAKTGVAVNVASLNKGLIERLRAEDRRSPADLVLTVDISRLHGVKDAGLTQPVQNDALTNNTPPSSEIQKIIGLVSPRGPVLSMPPKTVSLPTR